MMICLNAVTDGNFEIFLHNLTITQTQVISDADGFFGKKTQVLNLIMSC